MRQEEEGYASLQRQLVGRYGQCVEDIKTLLSSGPSSTDELLRDVSAFLSLFPVTNTARFLILPPPDPSSLVTAAVAVDVFDDPRASHH